MRRGKEPQIDDNHHRLKRPGMEVGAIAFLFGSATRPATWPRRNDYLVVLMEIGAVVFFLARDNVCYFVEAN